MPKVSTGKKSLSLAVEKDTHKIFVDHCETNGMSINQRLKMLVYDDLDMIPFGFYSWPLEEQCQWLRGK